MNRFSRWLLGALLTIAGFSSGVAQEANDQKPNVLVASESDIFPASWRRESINARATPLARADRRQKVALASAALSKYPAKLLEQNLATTYIVGRLEFSGIRASGSNSRDNIYLAGAESTDAWFERVLHSELSSILLRKHPELLDRSGWESTNPSGFRYGRSGVAAVKTKRIGKLFDPALLSAGFVGRYAQSTLENDFNAVAGQLWLGEPKLWRAAEEHPGIRRKLQLTMDFYLSLDGTLTESFFRRLAPIDLPAQAPPISDSERELPP